MRVYPLKNNLTAMWKKYRNIFQILLSVMKGNYILILPNKELTSSKTLTDMEYATALQVMHGVSHVDRRNMFPSDKGVTFTTIEGIRIAFPDVYVVKDTSLQGSTGHFTYANRTLRLPTFWYLRVKNGAYTKHDNLKIKVTW